MMRSLLSVAALGLVCGCATPSDVRKSPQNEIIVRPAPLETIALCITHGFDEKMYSVNNLRISHSGESAEMIALAPGSSTVNYIVDFQTVPEGTAVHYYINSGNLFRDSLANMIRAIINAC